MLISDVALNVSHVMGPLQLKLLADINHWLILIVI